MYSWFLFSFMFHVVSSCCLFTFIASFTSITKCTILKSIFSSEILIYKAKPDMITVLTVSLLLALNINTACVQHKLMCVSDELFILRLRV